ncbi:TPA: hypothetical protein N0F65_009212 [Lagenidium giganteum]|uniref:Macro domain-containing protein n=1 Tax=Lagenidium giganteum TaxID=4803 RepID=A0AAV2YTS9_9STRA|nr:TPA: hypothetical protein N0F65_009212 [Lagenidium giganteum]
MSLVGLMDNEALMRQVLFFLDFEGVDGLLGCLQADCSVRSLLHDTKTWRELTLRHFGGVLPPALAFLALPTRARCWNWCDEDVACRAAREFLRTGDERQHFDAHVHIIKGDIGHVQSVNGQPLDGIGFPTNPHLTNHYIGAAAAIFKRAGPDLTGFVNDPLVRGRRNVGEVVVTPGFQSGVKRLIHCVGPRISQAGCYDLLQQTYENLLSAILRENLQTVAIVSISTGHLGVPAKEGAQVAMRCIQNFIRANHWEGTLGVVCFEDNVFHEFVLAKTAVLESFNATPPLPQREEPAARRAFGAHPLALALGL